MASLSTGTNTGSDYGNANPNAAQSNRNGPALPPPPARLNPKGAPQKQIPKVPTNLQTVQQFNFRVTIPLNNTNEPTNIPAVFQKLMGIINYHVLRANHTFAIYRFTNRDENPIENISDLPLTEECYTYYHGKQVKTKFGRTYMSGSVALRSTMRPYDIKNISEVWKFINNTGIYIEPSNLIASKHRTIGWIQNSHPQYTNRIDAVNALKKRINMEDADIELIAGQISNSMGTTTRALKVNTALSQSQEIHDALIATACDDYLDKACPTWDFHFIPIKRSTLFTEPQFDALLRQQNAYLADVVTIDVKNLASVHRPFTASEEYENKTLAEVFMDKLDANDDRYFYSINKGREGTYRFLTSQSQLIEAQNLIDSTLAILIDELGKIDCMATFGFLEPVRINKNVSSKLASKYIATFDFDQSEETQEYTAPPKRSTNVTLATGGPPTVIDVNSSYSDITRISNTNTEIHHPSRNSTSQPKGPSQKETSTATTANETIALDNESTSNDYSSTFASLRQALSSQKKERDELFKKLEVDLTKHKKNTNSRFKDHEDMIQELGSMQQTTHDDVISMASRLSVVENSITRSTSKRQRTTDHSHPLEPTPQTHEQDDSIIESEADIFKPSSANPEGQEE